MKDKVAFAQLGMQFSVMMDKYLVILEVLVTKFLKKSYLLFPSPSFKIYHHLQSTFTSYSSLLQNWFIQFSDN